MHCLAWLVYCWRRPFVLSNEDAFPCDPAKKKSIFVDLYRPGGGGGGLSEHPQPPIATPLEPVDFGSLCRSTSSGWNRKGMMI